MLDWNERANGNFVARDSGLVTTVFRDHLGSWLGIREGEVTERGFDTAQAAMDAIDNENVKFVVAKWRPIDTGWCEAKKGGSYRQTRTAIVTVKQAKSGKWYVTLDGALVEGNWLNTEDEARRLADRLLY